METVLLFVLVICIIAYLPRLLFPWIMRQLAKRAQKHFSDLQDRAAESSSNTNAEATHHDKKVDRNIGEYVDYEEIKDTQK